MHSHLTKQQRIELSILLRAGLSMRAIARMLNVHHSTVSRELVRNQPIMVVKRYDPGDAQRKTRNRRLNANQRFRKILYGSKLERIITDKIRIRKWAPEQVAGWLKTYRQRLYVCAQTIYDWIYTTKRELLPFLHCRKGKYRRTRENTLRKLKRARLASARHISKRPKHIEYRKTYGHWEGDTIHGAGKSGYIATFVERKSGYLRARLITKADFGASGFASSVQGALKDIPERYRTTLTLDNGSEMAYAEQIERLTGVRVYYATPYHSWERGSNENTNGLLRYFFPKKMSFAHLTQEEIDEAVHLINTRPRKRLNWRTPEQMFKI
jgi:IS30 family transposase